MEELTLQYIRENITNENMQKYLSFSLYFMVQISQLMHPNAMHGDVLDHALYAFARVPWISYLVEWFSIAASVPFSLIGWEL